MSFLSQFDPTSRGSAFGGAVRAAIGKVPGGAEVLGAVDQYNARSRVTDRGAGGTATGTLTESERAGLAAPWYKRPLIIGGAVVALVVVVLGFVFMRRR